MPIILDKAVPSVENGVIRVRIGTDAYIIKGLNVNIDYSDVNSATVEWLRNGQLYHSRGNTTVITVTDANDGDVFTCVTDNEMRLETKLFFVHKYFCI